MEENPDQKYYPTYFLLVTGFSFLLFALFLSLVDNQDARFFWWTGGISFAVGLLVGIYILTNKIQRVEENKESPVKTRDVNGL